MFFLRQSKLMVLFLAGVLSNNVSRGGAERCIHLKRDGETSWWTLDEYDAVLVVVLQGFALLIERNGEMASRIWCWRWLLGSPFRYQKYKQRNQMFMQHLWAIKCLLHTWKDWVMPRRLWRFELVRNLPLRKRCLCRVYQLDLHSFMFLEDCLWKMFVSTPCRHANRMKVDYAVQFVTL